LQTKTVDGQENPMSLIWSSHFYDVQKHMTLWNYSYDAIAFAAGSGFWDQLDEADQKLFQEAAQEAMKHEREVVAQEDDELPDELAETGVTVTKLSDDELKVFQEALQPTY